MRAPLKIHRPQWSFPELQELFRFKGDLDLRRMVMAGTINPAMHFCRGLHPASIEAGLPLVNVEEEIAVEGWLFAAQEHAKQVDNFECFYSLWRNTPLAVEGAQYFALPETMTLSALLRLAVVFDGNVQAIQRGRKDDPDRDLSEKEEKTRDKMLCVFAVEHLGWRPWEEGRDFALAGFLEAANEIGLKVSRNAVKEHLQLAWERAKPMQEK